MNVFSPKVSHRERATTEYKKWEIRILHLRNEPSASNILLRIQLKEGSFIIQMQTKEKVRDMGI